MYTKPWEQLQEDEKKNRSQEQEFEKDYGPTGRVWGTVVQACSPGAHTSLTAIFSHYLHHPRLPIYPSWLPPTTYTILAYFPFPTDLPAGGVYC